MIVVIAADFAQAFGQLLLEFVDDRVGVETQLRYLLAYHLYIMRMTVTDRDDGMSAVEVEVLGALLVPDVAAPAFYYINIK